MTIRKTGSLAQLNRAFDYGSKGYRFESCGSHKRKPHKLRIIKHLWGFSIYLVKHR